MIFDTPPKQSTPSSLQKSPHHKSTSALSDVQMTTPTSKGAASSHLSVKGKVHTLAPTDSPSYLSSIGGYTDDFDLSPSSSIASGGNVSFVSNSGSGVQQNRGAPGYHGGGGDGTRGGLGGATLGNLDLADEILQHMSGGGEIHSHSPTGNYHSSSSSSSTSSSHKHVQGRRVDIPAASSPVTRYKRASSPTIGFPTDSRQHFVLDNHTHHMTQHHRDGRRSHSPDLAGGRGHEASYNPPSMAVAGHRKQSNLQKSSKQQPQQHYQQQQQRVGGGVALGGVAPANHFHMTGGGMERKQDVDPRGEPRFVGAAHGSKTLPSTSRTQQHPPGGHGNTTAAAMSAAPSMGPGAGPGAGEPGAVPHHRGPRKASDQEMGLLEVLNMWDKSNKNPFGDGTLV